MQNTIAVQLSAGGKRTMPPYPKYRTKVIGAHSVPVRTRPSIASSPWDSSVGRIGLGQRPPPQRLPLPAAGCEGRVLSRKSPAIPSCMYRSCQRQTQFLLLSALPMSRTAGCPLAAAIHESSTGARVRPFSVIQVRIRNGSSCPFPVIKSIELQPAGLEGLLRPRARWRKAARQPSRLKV